MHGNENVNIVEMIDSSPVPNREVVESYSSNPLKFFKLHNHPFADSVNPKLFYRTDAHEAAFMAMKRCIEDDVSLGLTTAVAGTGKTLLTQVLLQDLEPDQYEPVLILIYPKMSRTALLKEICCELQITLPGKRPNSHELISAIQQRIMELYLKKIKPVLIIDEVHFLTSDNLQVLRTLSNIEVPERKLLTILLFGENTFLQKLKNPTFKSILSRMYTRVQLRPLNCNEVEQYVKYRLLLSHGNPGIFENSCFAWLHETSEGVPREINRLCHNAMQYAAQHALTSITDQILHSANPDG